MGNLIKRGENIAVRPEAVIEARFSLTSKQNDILDMIFCEIEDDEKYKYTVSVEKYKYLYNTDTSNIYRDIKKAVKSFEGKGFRIINKENKEEIYYSWFSKIHYIPKRGEIQVNIDLDFKKLLCEVKKRIYYDIKYTLNFNSVYSQRVYYYLKSFEDTGWRIDYIEDLQRKLECPESYKNFANFKKYVLDIAERDINGYSDILFKYETKKKGNKIISIKSYITSKKGRNSIKDTGDNKEYTTQEMSKINSVRTFLQENVGNNTILTFINDANGDIELIKEKYILMKRQKHVDNIVAWLRNAIRYKDNYKSEPTISYSKLDSFNDYPQRNYNFNELERKFGGWDNNNSNEKITAKQIALDLNE